MSSALNEKQNEAVMTTEGPLLILAGAGSGKTRVLTYRVAYLIAEKHIDPWNIMAITFTNKAAAEMRERVDRIVPEGASAVWVATFHSSCVRFLRRFIDRIGFDNHFTIYDSDDQKTLMKRLFKQLQIDPKNIKERAVLHSISAAKDKLIDPSEYEKEAADYYERKTAVIYKEYQKALKANNALDFDDLIVKTVEMFEKVPEVLEYYRQRFRYIMVDEYQDTNTAQFKLVEMLAGRNGNLCVVGDDDQSIYRFRGADIENILNFEHTFPGAKVVKLEQNYRSTGNILNAANAVIRNNRTRKSKTLWTSKEAGEKICLMQFATGWDEAAYIVGNIDKRSAGGDYSKFAVLYRTNAQSRLLEEQCVAHSVPYQLVGGVNFYQRKEIKDILAYLKTIANGQDDLALLRIINVPKRGIGNTTMEKVQAYALEHSMSMYDACKQAYLIPSLARASEKIKVFTDYIEQCRTKAGQLPVSEMIEHILHDTGYDKEIQAEGEIEAQSRFENIAELVNKAVSFENDSEDISDDDRDEMPLQTNGGSVLDRFLEEVALVADIDRMDESQSRITLMTLHAAKGLEFDEVYLAGMEDGLFPGNMSINSDDKTELEEERRLCYVGITRAKKRLTLTFATHRMVNGETRWSRMSRFLEEIPEDLIEKHLIQNDRSSDDENYSQRRFAYSGEDNLPWNAGRKKDSRPGQPGTGRRTPDKSFRSAPVYGLSKDRPVKADSLDYSAGDRVKHFKFGEGTVKEIRDGGRDFEVTVDFDNVGTKKMFAAFAKLQKI